MFAAIRISAVKDKSDGNGRDVVLDQLVTRYRYLKAEICQVTCDSHTVRKDTEDPSSPGRSPVGGTFLSYQKSLSRMSAAQSRHFANDEEGSVAPIRCPAYIQYLMWLL